MFGGCMLHQEFREIVKHLGIECLVDYDAMYSICKLAPFQDGALVEIEPIRVKLETPISTRYKGAFWAGALRSVSLTKFAKEDGNLYNEAFVKPYAEVYRIMDEEKSKGNNYFMAALEGTFSGVVTFEDMVDGDVLRHEARIPVIEVGAIRTL